MGFGVDLEALEKRRTPFLQLEIEPVLHQYSFSRLGWYLNFSMWLVETYYLQRKGQKL